MHSLLPTKAKKPSVTTKMYPDNVAGVPPLAVLGQRKVPISIAYVCLQHP